MRPLKLMMTAFGPYANEQIIDFTELGSRNLFVITGDTGAGKTTVLDAISYALYGKASGRDRDNESLRSHFARADVLTTVELDFEIAGQRYWIRRVPKQRKAKARGLGSTDQNAEAELKTFDGETAVIAGVTEVNNKLIQLMGLTYDQFKQIIMIPQGEFRELLTADSKARQDILQKIFGTEVLRRIQELLEGKASTLSRAVTALTGQRSELIRSVDGRGYPALDELLRGEPYPVQQVFTELAKAVSADVAMANELQALIIVKEKIIAAKQADIFKGQEINRQLIERDEAQQKQQLAESQLDKMEQKQKVLQNAKRALILQAVDDDCRSRVIVAQEKERQFIQAVKQEQAAAIAVVRTKQSYHLEKAKEEPRNQLLAEQAKLEGLRAKVADWDTAKQKVAELQEKLEKVKNDKDGTQQRLETTRQEMITYQAGLDRAKTAAVDYARLEIEFAQAADRYAKIQVLQEENDRLATLRQSYRRLQREEELQRKNYEQSQQDYETAQRSFLEGQAGQLAAKLVAGEPCPVCGSTEHIHPAVFLTAIPCEAELKKLRDFEKTVKATWDQANQTFQRIHAEGSAQQKIVLRLQQELHRVVAEDLLDLEKERLTSYIIAKLPVCKREMAVLTDKLEELAKYKQAEQNFVTKLAANNRAVTELEKRSAELTSVYIMAFSQLQSLKDVVKALEAELALEIRSMEKLQQAINQIRDRFELMKRQFEQSEQQFNDSKVYYAKTLAVKEAAQKSLAEAQAEYEKSSQRFREALLANKFATEIEYQQAKLDENSINLLDKEIVAYFEALRSIRDHCLHSQQQVEGLTTVDIEALVAARNIVQAEKDQLSDRRTMVLSRKSLNQNMLERITLISDQLGQQEQEYQLIGHLARIAKGDNDQKVSFERYVLAAFFNDIIHAANTRLEAMTGGRYRMNRMVEKGKGSGQSGLELEVFDYYTGQSRHVKTLSGGESFKASLALALGLAEVVQYYAGGISLETMFVDEGFGTLDSESLDQAINCLIDLQHSGRLVGIISHVPELKASVDARLEIEAGKDGSSAHFCVL
jgi:exonuclease SbcC